MSSRKRSVTARRWAGAGMLLGAALIGLSVLGGYEACGPSKPCGPNEVCEAAFSFLVVAGGGAGALLMLAGFVVRFFATRHERKLVPGDTRD